MMEKKVCNKNNKGSLACGYVCTCIGGTCTWVKCTTDKECCEALGFSWDESENKCILCDSNTKTELRVIDIKTKSVKSGDNLCEAACGANPSADEKERQTVSYNIFIDENCGIIECNEQNRCKNVKDKNGNTYICINLPFYEWVRKEEIPCEGCFGLAGACFNNIDDDCNGPADCKDSTCRGVRNPNNPEEVCCLDNSDCTNVLGNGWVCDLQQNKCVKQQQQPPSFECKNDNYCKQNFGENYYCFCGWCNTTSQTVCENYPDLKGKGYCCTRLDKDTIIDQSSIGNCVGPFSPPIRYGNAWYICDPYIENNYQIKNSNLLFKILEETKNLRKIFNLNFSL